MRAVKRPESDDGSVLTERAEDQGAMKKPLITNIQKYSIHDGPGTRTTVFFKGCPLACRWCHNPETQSYTNGLLFYEERCTGCGYCADVCPEGAVSLAETEEALETVKTASGRAKKAVSDGGDPVGEPVGSTAVQAEKAAADGGVGNEEPVERPAGHVRKAVTDAAKCTACGACVEECLHNAREICARAYEIPDLVKELLKDRIFYETSGGGATLSGGEVLSQNMDYVEELMKRLHFRGVSVNVDTCGAVPWAALERALPWTDIFLYDVKLMDPARHRLYTGRDNAEILSNLIHLSRTGAKIWIRIPVIGGVNDGPEEICKIGDFLKKNDVRALQVNLLPYHNTGSGKYGRAGMTYQGNDFYTPKPEAMERLAEAIAQYVSCAVRIGG